jgi:hypothetical protein
MAGDVKYEMRNATRGKEEEEEEEEEDGGSGE